MKNIILSILILASFGLKAQTLTKNFTMTIEPKKALSINQVNLETNPAESDSITLSAPVGSGTFDAKQKITLKPGFHATGNVSLVIKPGADPKDYISNITYHDGLGRPIQIIAKGQSPQGKDIIKHITYDQFGREDKSYLPYPSTQNSGNFISNAISQQSSYYQNNYNDTYSYSKTLFDGSPLNRVLKSSSPGSDWKIVLGSDTDHTVKYAYNANGKFEIRKYSIEVNGSINSSQYYTMGQLTKTIVKNENWKPTDGLLNTTETFVNKDGNTIATVSYENVNGVTTKRINQKVYDRKGLLRFIFPPKAMENPTNINQEILDGLCYLYEYDQYNRIIRQKSPGKDWELMVYDFQDRPIFTQDANLAVDNKWLFTKYDVFDRPVYAGIYLSTLNRKQLQAEVDTFLNNSTNKANIEKRTGGITTIGGISMNYSNSAFPTSGVSEVLAVYYYDDYNFNDSDKPSTPASIQGQTVTNRTKGLQTASWIKTLGQNSWNKTYMYYNNQGRELKIHNKNYSEGYTTNENKIDFRGNLDLSVTKHKQNNSATEIEITDRFEFDNAERNIIHYQTVNNQIEELITKNEFDELGMLVKKYVGGLSTATSALQEISFDQNIRGQLQKINDIDNLGAALFAYKINYNESAQGAVNVPSNYNGNITQSIWRSSYDNLKKAYAYSYDTQNRLTNSYYSFNDDLNGQASGRFDLRNVNYDSNGNITSLLRNDYNGVLDILTYTYSSTNPNQLLIVSDTGNTTKGFVDGNISGNDFEYDANGNLTKDRNKGISSIKHNHLDLVTEIVFDNGNKIEFLYDATGAKLEKKYTVNGNAVSTQYLSGFQYQQGALLFFPTPEGYAYKEGNVFKHAYVYSDHLGNNRLSYTDANSNGIIENTEVLSTSDYYPFGGLHSGEFISGMASNYNYKFQGKELQTEENITLYDFGSRLYDPSLGRWFSTDPQNQFGSPYLALGNNPVSLVDPDGELAFVPILLGAALGGFFGGIKSDQSGGTFLEGYWKGAISGAVGGAAAQLIPTAGIEGFLHSSAAGATNGFAAGFSSTLLESGLNGQSFNESFDKAFRSGRDGAALGGLINGIQGLSRANRLGLNPITGNSKGIKNADPSKISKIRNGLFRRKVIAYYEPGGTSDFGVRNFDTFEFTPFYGGDRMATLTIKTRVFDAKATAYYNALDLAQKAQSGGEILSYAGYALTASVIGAEVGVPMASLGNGMSFGGSLVESALTANYKQGAAAAATELAGHATKKYIAKKIPFFRIVDGKTINQNWPGHFLDQTISLKFGQIEKSFQLYYGY